VLPKPNRPQLEHKQHQVLHSRQPPERNRALNRKQVLVLLRHNHPLGNKSP